MTLGAAPRGSAAIEPCFGGGALRAPDILRGVDQGGISCMYTYYTKSGSQRMPGPWMKQRSFSKPGCVWQRVVAGLG